MNWKKLINYWCNEKGRYGMTIPFLIGAERLSREMTIKSLLTEIKESDSKFLISSCGDLDEYVIGTHKPEYAYINSLKNFGSLIINDDELEKIKTMKELIEKMENEYLEKTENELYSKNYDSGEWTAFEDSDIELIESIN
ncbi:MULTISPECIES: hypothetical protein [Mesonia]|uniref:Uncharacterized protein n=1 Tax=Mesonia oceanica TaxID=2687242 RepID=A0AC61YDK5_9FLAO|nr:MULTISPECIES: hypothetical protein [Mesonia]MAN28094.1 hypothetical protein [Mesonia sp.]MAQ39790.1 hypothetical protein [Mesonia sp.]MBJ98878.1 hypothetical protein [Flavobacteriaceae bacterium]VVV02493.1 hypothetical protein FVB9532_03792 [Mesonia oceanica]|tara:strand:+ start:161 stop:580 length:420 start_codon:yes stop_codon:yes gene_type:complete